MLSPELPGEVSKTVRIEAAVFGHNISTVPQLQPGTKTGRAVARRLSARHEEARSRDARDGGVSYVISEPDGLRSFRSASGRGA